MLKASGMIWRFGVVAISTGEPDLVRSSTHLSSNQQLEKKSPSEFLSINILSPWHLDSWVSGDLGSFRNLRYWSIPYALHLLPPPKSACIGLEEKSTTCSFLVCCTIYSYIFHVWCFQRKWCPAACSFPCPTTKKPIQKVVLQRGPTSLPERRTPRGWSRTLGLFLNGSKIESQGSGCMSGINF